jgi:alkylated DNA nucleotide flippase Atl1
MPPPLQLAGEAFGRTRPCTGYEKSVNVEVYEKVAAVDDNLVTVSGYLGRYLGLVSQPRGVGGTVHERDPRTTG